MTVDGVPQGCRSRSERQEPMDKDTLIAHVRKNEDGSWAPPQPLIDHIEGSARLASEFAETFDSSAWGYAEKLAHYEANMHPNQNRMGGYLLLPVPLKGLHIFIERLGRIGRYHALVQFLIQSNVYGERGACRNSIF